jgi:hypothetical protein
MSHLGWRGIMKEHREKDSVLVVMRAVRRKGICFSLAEQLSRAFAKERGLSTDKRQSH